MKAEDPISTMDSNKTRQIKLAVFIALGILLFAWLLNTPPGLLGKADAVGYAVCHRIDLRSFHLGDRQISFCARCTGMYLAAFFGILFQLFLGRRRTEYPPKNILIVLGVFFLAFAFDGSNSLIQLIRDGKGLLYTTTNTIRLITGTGMGFVLAVLVTPAFNQSVWLRYSKKSTIENWKQFAGLLFGGLIIILLILSENPLVLYPLSLISAAGVLLLLTMIYTMLLLMIFKRENKADKWQELILPISGGLFFALVQIALLDYGRFLLTNTWTGFGF